MRKNSAFTLAEIMIVLTVIGILTAILLPVAFQATPDEKVMKFKKANSTLGTVIRELVNSDRYYKDGDLGTKADGTIVKGTDNQRYFCATVSELLSIKEVSCEGNVCPGGTLGSTSTKFTVEKNKDVLDEEYIDDIRDALDQGCKMALSYKDNLSYITTSDNITYYEPCSTIPFGHLPDPKNVKGSVDSGQSDYGKYDFNEFDASYKVFCIDVDGFDGSEEPFGYGIRRDGRILPGARANEYINKSIQKGE